MHPSALLTGTWLPQRSQGTLTAFVLRVPHIPSHPSSAVESLSHAEWPHAPCLVAPPRAWMSQRSPRLAHMLLGPEPPRRCRPSTAEGSLP